MLRRSVLAAIVSLTTTSVARACPMCKLALESDDPQPRAYMLSILFMLGMITSLFVGVAVLAWWINRKEQQALIAAGYEHVLENAVNGGIPEAYPAQ